MSTPPSNGVLDSSGIPPAEFIGVPREALSLPPSSSNGSMNSNPNMAPLNPINGGNEAREPEERPREREHEGDDGDHERERNLDSTQPQAAKIWVGNVPHSATKADFVEFFKECGKVTDVDLKKDYAFLYFATDEGVERALKFDGKEMLGRVLRVQRSRSQPRVGGRDRCYFCNETGHWARDCRKRTGSSTTKRRSRSRSHGRSRSRSRSPRRSPPRFRRSPRRSRSPRRRSSPRRASPPRYMDRRPPIHDPYARPPSPGMHYQRDYMYPPSRDPYARDYPFEPMYPVRDREYDHPPPASFPPTYGREMEFGRRRSHSRSPRRRSPMRGRGPSSPRRPPSPSRPISRPRSPMRGGSGGAPRYPPRDASPLRRNHPRSPIPRGH